MKFKKILFYLFPVFGSVILPVLKALAYPSLHRSKITELLLIIASIIYIAVFTAHLYVFYIKNTPVKNAEIIISGAIPLITSIAISISKHRYLIWSRIGMNYYAHMLFMFIYIIMLTQKNKKE